jgi:hypothetical protein
MEALVKSVLDSLAVSEHGIYGVVIILCVYVIRYQNNAHVKERAAWEVKMEEKSHKHAQSMARIAAENAEMMQKLHDEHHDMIEKAHSEHRKDRDDWFNSQKTFIDKMIAKLDDNTRGLAEFKTTLITHTRR